jgi:serine/threonine protein kinase
MNQPGSNQPARDQPEQTRLDQLGPAQLLQLNQWCDQFEQNWSAAGSGSLASFLAALPESQRETAAAELVLVDMECRQQRGLAVSAELYSQLGTGLDPDWINRQIERVRARPVAVIQQGPQPGESIGDYRVLGPLGAGGMGSVFRAEHGLMKRLVALKVIRQQNQSDPLARRRFEREVRALARLSHPNIVAAFDAREDNGVLYLVTELVDGEDLGKLVRRKGPIAPIKVAHYGWQAAKGLHYAHGQGLVHRDVKPENLLLDRQRNIKILDLGLARWHAGEDTATAQRSLTQTDQILGTARYMSPEQARAPNRADARNDIYSLGCTLFFLLTGRPPYSGESALDTMLAHASAPVPSVAESTAGTPIPAELDALVQRMMAKDPAARPGNMQAVVNDLARIVKLLQRSGDDSVVSIEPQRTGRFAARMPRSSVAVSWMLAGTALALLAAAIGFRSWVNRATNGAGSSSNGNPVAGGQIRNPADDRPDETAQPPGRDSGATDDEAATSARGLYFNGTSSFVEVPAFDMAPDGIVTIEAFVRPERQGLPSNIVSWTGPRCFVLFRSQDNRWGVAWYEENSPRLVLAQQPVQLNRDQFVAARKHGNRLELFVDGEAIATTAISYPLTPAPPRLYVGGVPDGHLPRDQGTRFFQGTISLVRVSRGDSAGALAVQASDFTSRADTLAMFDFRTGSGTSIEDLTSHRWQAKLFDARWRSE